LFSKIQVLKIVDMHTATGLNKLADSQQQRLKRQKAGSKSLTYWQLMLLVLDNQGQLIGCNF
jgi:hypothetical protein